jgi:hypothetical protein
VIAKFKVVGFAGRDFWRVCVGHVVGEIIGGDFKKFRRVGFDFLPKP